MLQRSILICDSDPILLEQLQQPVPQVIFLTADTPARAQHLIADHRNRLASICVSSRFADPAALPLLRFIRTHRPAAPVALLLEEGASLPENFDLESLTLSKAIRKPVTPQQLANELIPAAFLDLSRDIASGHSDNVATGTEAEIDDEGLHPIDAESFLCGSKSFFDIYVRLSPRKYVKIVKAGEAIEPEWVASFLKRGVRHFHIRKEAQGFFLSYCDQLTEKLLQLKNVPAEIKLQQVENLGRETFDFLRSHGASETSLYAAQRFVGFSHRLVGELRLKGLPNVRSLVDKIRGTDHTNGTLMIVSAILGALDFRDEAVITTIGLGAFLHDIGLELLPEELRKSNYEDLDEAGREKYEQHPMLGADAMRDVPNLSPLVAQVVRQHHERRNRKGYPAKLGAGAIAPMAELTGIADSFHHLIERSVREPGLDPLAEIQESFDDFSFQTVEGFRKAFLAK